MSKIKRETVRQWLSNPWQWRIPVYQRHYAWDADEEYGATHLFWEVVEKQATERLKAARRSGKPPSPHYFGAVLVAPQPTDEMDSIQRFDVVDGQQRLTTINIALFSVIGWAMSNGLGDQVKAELAKYIFVNPDNPNANHSKLLPTNFDKTQYQNLLMQAYSESDPDDDVTRDTYNRSMVVLAWKFFNDEVSLFIEKNEGGDSEPPYKALIDTLLDGFELVVIPLSKTDEAQSVFESINNTARPLKTFDLIRNNVFHRASKESTGNDVTLFNQTTWQEFEKPEWEEWFNKKGDSEHIETYVARMLIAKTKEPFLIKRDAIYRQYKKYATSISDHGLAVSKEIKDMASYVPTYKYLAMNNASNPTEDQGASVDFGYFRTHVKEAVIFLPLMFIISTCKASVKEKQRMVNLLESWFIRRSICELEGDTNKQIPTICKELGDKPDYKKLASLLKEAGQEISTKWFPEDKAVASSLKKVHFGRSRKKLLQYLFERIVWKTTNPNRNENRDSVGFTIDHIFPQSWRDTEWAEVVKGIDEYDVDEKIDTIGNLTPLARGTNAVKGNQPWGRNKESGARRCLAKSDLTMTRELADKDKWDIDEIDNRSDELAKIICKIWLYEIDE